MAVEITIGNVDVELLGQQRDGLLEMDGANKKDREVLDGVVNLLDAMLDVADAQALKIVPVNEPNGEGNGWEQCAEKDATGFEVDQGGALVEFFTTRKQAEAFVAKAAL